MDLITIRTIDDPNRGFSTGGAALLRGFGYGAAGSVDAAAIQDEDFPLGQNPVVDETSQCVEDARLFIEASHDDRDERRSTLRQITPLVL
jgi:hypothetical protein